MFNVNDFKINNIDKCYPDNIRLHFDKILIKAYFCGNKPYNVIMDGYMYTINIDAYAVLTYYYKLYVARKNLIHQDIFNTHKEEFKDITIHQHIRDVSKIRQQGRIFTIKITEQQGKKSTLYTICLLVLWKNDYENWVTNKITDHFPNYDRYILMRGVNQFAYATDLLTLTECTNIILFKHPIEQLNIIPAKYHYYRYIGD